MSIRPEYRTLGNFLGVEERPATSRVGDLGVVSATGQTPPTIYILRPQAEGDDEQISAECRIEIINI